MTAPCHDQWSAFLTFAESVFSAGLSLTVGEVSGLALTVAYLLFDAILKSMTEKKSFGPESSSNASATAGPNRIRRALRIAMWLIVAAFVVKIAAELGAQVLIGRDKGPQLIVKVDPEGELRYGFYCGDEDLDHLR